eukprot:scaffold1696_cov166-Cylindrotheca_fusiformis.AAC.3
MEPNASNLKVLLVKSEGHLLWLDMIVLSIFPMKIAPAPQSCFHMCPPVVESLHSSVPTTHCWLENGWST